MFITNLNENRRNSLNDLFDEMIDDVFRIYPNSYNHNDSSEHKIETDDDGVTLTINVPGYNDKLIDVSVSGDKLTIEGKSHTGSTEGFNHTCTINDNLDADEIDATAIDGVLTVSIPYAEAVKPRKIEVKVK